MSKPRKTYAELVWPSDRFLARDLPAREWIVPEAIPHPSLGMLVAQRGSGKTFTSMRFALDIAAGKPWMMFKGGGPRGVLYVDGEMSLIDMQTRLRGMMGAPCPHFHILASEDLALENQELNLAEEACRERLSYTLIELERRTGTPVQLLVLDNWSSLVRGLDENDNTQLDGIRQWLILLRHAEVSVLLVHHMGTAGRQRGASAREDNLDYTLTLQQLESGEGHSRFQIAWDKCRGPRPTPDKFVQRLRAQGTRLVLEPESGSW